MAKTPSLMDKVPPFEEVIGTISELSDEAYAALRNAVSSEDAFDTSPERCADLSELMGVARVDTFLILRAVALIYDRVRSLSPKLPVEQVIVNFVDEALPDLANDRKKILVARLNELSKENPGVEIYRKRERLKSGFLHSAIEFESFVDLRPDFDEAREKILGFIPLVQFRIVTEDGGSMEELVFQLDEKSLLDLKAAVELAQKKLTTLKATNALNAPLFFGKDD